MKFILKTTTQWVKFRRPILSCPILPRFSEKGSVLGRANRRTRMQTDCFTFCLVAFNFLWRIERCTYGADKPGADIVTGIGALVSAKQLKVVCTDDHRARRVCF